MGFGCSEALADFVPDSQIKQASIEHAPYQTEESWVDSVAEASAAGAELAEPDAENIARGSDPTVTHAGLSEINDAGQPNGVQSHAHQDIPALPSQGSAGDSAGNTAGDCWDPAMAGADKSIAEEGYEMVPRPQDEVDNPSLLQPTEKRNWADEMPPEAATGNQAGEGWDVKAPGEQLDNTWSGGDATAAAGAVTTGGGVFDGASGGPGQEEGDGFSQVAGRQRARGGRGGRRGGEGPRGPGRGAFRGNGEFRGRGAFRGDRGEFRGRGGRGRGPRGGSGGEGPLRGS